MVGTVLICLAIPFLGTTLGAAMVFFLKKEINEKFQKILLGFASGVMMYVVFEELIPEANSEKHSNLATIGFSIGFIIMMFLDVALG